MEHWIRRCITEILSRAVKFLVLLIREGAVVGLTPIYYRGEKNLLQFVLWSDKENQQP